MRKEKIIEIINSIWEAGTQNYKGYLIGGTALTIAGIQPDTKDIDIIFSENRDRVLFYEAAAKIGFELTAGDAMSILESGSEKPVEIYKDDIYIDMFNKVTTHFCLTSSIEERSVAITNNNGFGIYNVISQDILMMKSATGRNSDIAIANKIIDFSNIVWENILEEIEFQLDQKMDRAAYDFLELIQNDLIKEKVPSSVFEALIGLVETRLASIRRNCTYGEVSS